MVPRRHTASRAGLPVEARHHAAEKHMSTNIRALLLLIAALVVTSSTPAAEVLFQSLRDSVGVQFWMLTPDKQYIVYYEDGGTIRKVEIAHPENKTVITNARETLIPLPSQGYITPDSAWLFVFAGNFYYRIPMDGNGDTAAYPVPSTFEFVASPNPDWLLYTTNNTQLYAVPTRGDIAAHLVNPGFPSGTFLLNPDGEHLYFQLEKDNATILVQASVSIESATEMLESGDTWNVQLTSDGEYLVYTNYDSVTGTYNLYSRNTRTNSKQTVTTPVEYGYPNTTALSPQGDRALVVTAQGLYEYRLDGSTPPRLIDTRTGIRNPQYSPHGKWATATLGLNIVCWGLVEDAPPKTALLGYNGEYDAIFSPDEKWLVKARYSGTGDILQAYNLEADTPLGIDFSTGVLPSSSRFRSQWWWSLDSKVFFWVIDQSLYAFDTETSRSVVVYANAPRYFYSSPDFAFAGDAGLCIHADRDQGLVARHLTMPYLSQRMTQEPGVKRGTASIMGTTSTNKLLYFYSSDRDPGVYSLEQITARKVLSITRQPQVHFSQDQDVAFLRDSYTYTLFRSADGAAIDAVAAGVAGYDGPFWVTSDGETVFSSANVYETYCVPNCPDDDVPCGPDTCYVWVIGTSLSEGGFDGHSRKMGQIDFAGGSSFFAGPDEASAVFGNANRTFYASTGDEQTCILAPGELAIRRGSYLGMTRNHASLLLARPEINCPVSECVYALVTSSVADAREKIVYGPEPTQSLIQAVYSEQAGVALIANSNELLRIPLDPPGLAESIYPDNAHELMISADGRTAVFVHYPNGAPHELYSLNLTGTPNVRRCDPSLDAAYKLNKPIFTPDGNYLVYTAYTNDNPSRPVSLFSVSLRDSGPPVPLLLDDFSGRYFDYDISISLDSKLVALRVTQPGVGSKMFVTRVEGGGLVEMTGPDQYCASKGWWTYEGLYFTGSDYVWSDDQILRVPYDSRGGGEGEGEGAAEVFASADVDHNHRIDLSEVLRVIQLYNAGGLHCDGAAEDGYAPGVGDKGCAPHTSDYAPQDWRIGLSELLRAVQLYHAPGYAACPEGEDGFCAMP